MAPGRAALCPDIRRVERVDSPGEHSYNSPKRVNIVPNHRVDSKLDHILIALASSTRRAILRRLARGEARVTDLAQPFSLSLNSVSKHIRLLERAKLVKRQRIGREHVLTFSPRPLSAAQKWIVDQQALWSARLQALDDLLRDEDRTRRYGDV